MNAATYVRDISSLSMADAEEAGLKGANLGELISAGIPVPPAFVLTRASYLESMRAGGIDAELRAFHHDALIHVGSTARLAELCRRMQNLVHEAGIDGAVRRQALAAYHDLGANAVVAVRSSATGDVSSTGGLKHAITDVRGDDDLLDAISSCWASLFGPREIAYRSGRGFTGVPTMAVVVQRMIVAEKVGVAVTNDPLTGNADHVVVNAVFGKRRIVGCEVHPDTYVVDKKTRDVLNVRLGDKAEQIVSGPNGYDMIVKLIQSEAESRVLDDNSLRHIVDLAVVTEQHSRCPQHVEWAIASGRTWILRAQPIATEGKRPAAVASAAADSARQSCWMPPG